MGSSATQRLRRDGRVPAVLYGHGEGNEHLSIPAAQVKMLLRRRSKTVELAGAVKDTALVSEVQWDPLGIEVLHLDLIRVNLQELVHVVVAVHRHGDAAGLRQGGILIDNSHEVEIECPAGQIPESVGLNVTDLEMGGNMTAGELELPEGVSLVTSADSVIVHIEQPKGVDAEEAAEQLGEPEVISKGGDKTEEEG
jgi:large subunit ribosomal protein L25